MTTAIYNNHLTHCVLVFASYSAGDLINDHSVPL